MRTENRVPMLNLMYRRKLKGFTQQELSKQVGLHKNAVYLYESGFRKPDAATLAELAVALECSVDEIKN